MISGPDKGTRGKVLHVCRPTHRITVENVNLVRAAQMIRGQIVLSIVSYPFASAKLATWTR